MYIGLNDRVTSGVVGIKATTVDTVIRTWKKARLQCGTGALGYPEINILHPQHGILGGPEDDEDPAVGFVQGVVESFPAHIRAAFEAFHLAIIRGERCRDRPHEWRRMVLGIESRDVYEARCFEGWQIIREKM